MRTLGWWSRRLSLSILMTMGLAPSLTASTTTSTCGRAQCTFVAFGPNVFTRGTGAPQQVTVPFSVASPNAAYSLHVDNHLVSAAKVWVNDVLILSSSDFATQVTVLDRPVHLEAQNQLKVELQSQPNSSISLLIVGLDADAPSISYTESPPPNASGWHNTAVHVSFTCSDATSGIASCPSPIDLATEGFQQIISATASDKAGNSAVLSIPINIDETPPTISISSPSDGSVVATPSVSVLGSLSDALSGISAGTVTCNGEPAAVSGGAFNCVVSLGPGLNQIAVRAEDLAGNAAQASTSVTTQPTSPTQHLRITSIAPTPISAGSTTRVTITARVDVDVNLLPETVTVERYDPETRQSSPLARMYDDGTHGDALRGDNVFTALVDVAEPSPVIVFLRASASYQDLTQPVFSDIERLFVQATGTADQALSDLAARLEQGDIPGALRFFAQSEKTTRFLTQMTPMQRTRLVQLLRSLHLASDTGDVRTYSGPWLEPDGTSTAVEFGLSRDLLGQWVIFSW